MDETLECREFMGPSDLHAMIELLRAVRPPNHISDYPGIIDLQEMCGVAAIQKNTCLWETTPAGALAGFAITDPWDNLWFEFKPDQLTLELEREIIQWGEVCVRINHETGANQDEEPKLSTNCREDNFSRIAFLKRNGFVQDAMHTLQFICSLQNPIPEPLLPDGYTIRPVLGEAEVERLVDLHRAAFGSDVITVEYRLALMRVSGYDPRLDIVAVDRHGSLAAFCIAQIIPGSLNADGERAGSTDPVGTHPAHRRKGLARALMLTGFKLLKERGMTSVFLQTLNENAAMQRAAESVGYQIQAVKLWFSKPVF